MPKILDGIASGFSLVQVAYGNSGEGTAELSDPENVISINIEKSRPDRHPQTCLDPVSPGRCSSIVDMINLH
jgi:hypothetical protein